MPSRQNFFFLSLQSLLFNRGATSRPSAKSILSIWDGDEIEPTLVEGFGEVLQRTPFPSMVSLVWWNRGDRDQVDLCGGALYMRRYILTAAHCIQNPSKWELNAYLNPYSNPFPMEKIWRAHHQEEKLRSLLKDKTLRRKWLLQRDVYQTTHFDLRGVASSFLRGVQDGLGILLPDLQRVILHKGFHKHDQRVATKGIDDIGIIQLQAAPFPESSLAWSLFDVEIVDEPPNSGDTIVVYGSGAVEPKAQQCEGETCYLRQKALQVLSEEGCLDRLLARATSFAEVYISVDVVQRAQQLETTVENVEPVYEFMSMFLEFAEKRSRALQARWRAAVKAAQSENSLPSAASGYLTVVESQNGTRNTTSTLEDFLLSDVEAQELWESLGEPPSDLQQLGIYIESTRKLGYYFLTRDNLPVAPYRMQGVHNGLMLAGYSQSGNVQTGDSGGPIVNEGNELVGIAGLVSQTQGGNLLKHQGRGAFKGKDRLSRMPGFFLSAARYKPWIMQAVECCENDSFESCAASCTFYPPV